MGIRVHGGGVSYKARAIVHVLHWITLEKDSFASGQHNYHNYSNNKPVHIIMYLMHDGIATY